MQIGTDISAQPIGPIFNSQAVFFGCLTLEDGTDRMTLEDGTDRDCLTPKDGTDRPSRNVRNYQHTCVTSQKGEDPKYSATEASVISRYH